MLPLLSRVNQSPNEACYSKIMNRDRQFHEAQIAIFETLRHNRQARYSDMMRASGFDSDVFKYHVNRLLHDGMIAKREDSLYELTEPGKELANSIHEETRSLLKQPKLSLLMVVQSPDGRVLMHRRKRQPFFDFIGLPSGPARWGQVLETTAHDELMKQTGLSAEFNIIGMRRERDYVIARQLVEDNLFIIMSATAEGVIHTWYAGESMWCSRDEITNLNHLFTNTESVLAQVQQDQVYVTKDLTYDKEEF